MCVLHSLFLKEKPPHFSEYTHSHTEGDFFCLWKTGIYFILIFVYRKNTAWNTTFWRKKRQLYLWGNRSGFPTHRVLLLNTSLFESEMFYSMRKPLCFRIDRALSEMSLYCWNTSLKKFVLPMMLIAFSLLRTTHPLEYSLSTDSIHSKRSSLIGEDSTLLKKDFKSSGFSRKKISPTDSIERSGKHILRRSSSIAWMYGTIRLSGIFCISSWNEIIIIFFSCFVLPSLCREVWLPPLLLSGTLLLPPLLWLP